MASRAPRLKHAGVSTRVLLPVAAHLRSIGKDAVAFLRQAGIDPLSLFDPDAHVSHQLVLDVWRRAEELSRDHDLGLHVAESINFCIFDWMEYATEYLLLQLFMSSATLGEAFSRLSRYFSLAFDAARLDIDRVDGGVRVRHVMRSAPAVPRAFAEFSIGWMVRLARSAVARPVTPREIRFAHPEPESTAEHERVLGASTRFSAGENAFLLCRDDLSAPLLGDNPALLEVLERRAEEQLAELPAAESLVDRVRALIAAELKAGTPSAARVAAALDISVRTLTRRLGELGTSHKALLDEVRAELARHYLLEEKWYVADVAHFLGFSEARAFQRAFRRWYGRSPTEYRRAGAG
jgi:AraC-like DNA-binding protein